MMECPQCHSSNPPGAVRCTTCETPFEPGDATIGDASFGDATLGGDISASTPGVIGSTGWSAAAAPAVTGGFAASATSLAPGTLLGKRYEILQLLGQGGMGAVYKAKDRELDRFVAVKVIRPELAVHPEILQRFKQELILARQVTHKNVIRIYDLGEADGIKFITMQFVDGQDLTHILKEKGKLSIDETVRVIEQVCLALEVAHSEGVVHRDLKPQNIMVDGQGRVYVMDFGIARSTEAGAGMTQTGMLLGTPEYMSPEQVMGEHVDARSDLFTLGVIFYQLLTVSMPYKADTVQGAMFKRTRERPQPAISVDPQLPKMLSDIAAKCLEMDPAVRYQTAREIVQDLEAWRRGENKSITILGTTQATLGAGPATTVTIVPPPTKTKTIAIGAGTLVVVLGITGFLLRDRFSSHTPEKAVSNAPPAMSLAILPFRNASGDKSLDWLGSSVAEMLSTDVGQSAHLRTISSERVAQILHDLKISADTTFDSPTVGRLAEFSNADTVVWGEYAKFGDQIRIDATVQDIKRGRTTKLKTDAASEKEILAAVDHLAGDIRQKLDLSDSVVKELAAQSFKPSSQSLPALRNYNEGLQLARQGNSLEAVKQFEAATKADPDFALAYSQLAQTYASLGQDNEAEQNSRKAVELSDKLPSQEKYLIVARHDEILKNYAKAIESYEALARVSPDNADVLFDLGRLQENSGAFPKALESFSRVLLLDPKREEGLLAMGRVEIESGDAQKGLEYLNRAQSMAIEVGNEEQKANILQAIGVAYSVMNKMDDALSNYQESLKIKRRLGLKKGTADSLESIAQAEDLTGKKDAALKDYKEALQIRREIGDKAGTGDVLNDMAQFYDDHSQYDLALKLFKESLQIQIDVGNETNQALTLNNIGNTYLFKADYDNARSYFSQALQLRQKLNVPTDIADTLHNLAEISLKTGQYNEALGQYLKALDLRRSAGDKHGAAIESSSMGTLFGYQGRYGAALSSQEDALKTLRDINETGFWLADVIGKQGKALAQVARYGDAGKSFGEALNLARESKNQAQIAQTQTDQADSYFYQGDYKSAAPIYAQALQTAAHTTDQNLILLTKVNQGKLAVAQGNAQAVVPKLKALGEEADTLGLKYLSVECSVYLAEALTDSKNYTAAQQEVQRTLNKSEKLGLQVPLAQSHYLLGRNLEATGKANEAARHFNDARKILDDIQKESHNNEIVKRSDLSPIYAKTNH
jgi:serine/threonine protein kinase/tetratricopeptide (TPR) repeat protein